MALKHGWFKNVLEDLEMFEKEIKKALRSILSNPNLQFHHGLLYKRFYVNHHFNRFKQLVKYTLTLNPKNLIDIGSSDGLFIMTLLKMGYGGEVHSLELDADLIEKQKNNLKILGFESKVKLYHDDIQRINFPENYFDLLICSEVLEHVRNYNLALNRMIKSALNILITVPVETGPSSFPKNFIRRITGREMLTIEYIFDALFYRNEVYRDLKRDIRNSYGFQR